MISATGRPTRGFTLIELIVVIGIIGVLAGMLMGGVMVARHAAKRSITQATIAGLETAIKVFQNDWGFFPADNPASSRVASANISVGTVRDATGAALIPVGKGRSNPVLMYQMLTQKKNGPYFELKEEDIQLGTATLSGANTDWNSVLYNTNQVPLLLDAWGFPYVYDLNNPEDNQFNITGGPHNAKSFDIYSFGNDGIDRDGSNTGGNDDLNNW